MKESGITNQNSVFQQMEGNKVSENPIFIKNYNYNPVKEEDIKFFKKICGINHVLKEAQIVEDFARDEMTPEHLWKYPGFHHRTTKLGHLVYNHICSA